MYDPDIHSVRSGNVFTLTLATPAPERESKEPGDYEGLINKPRINGVELVGDLSWEDIIGVPVDFSKVPDEPLSDDDLDNIIES